MGKITKEMQLKHRDSLSPWLKSYVEVASTISLPLLPQHLATYPTRWPFGRGDLYHWIPLLNRFDAILEVFCTTYKLNLGPQTDDFDSYILRNLSGQGAFADEKQWDDQELKRLGYSQEGDRELVEAILTFSRLLLEHCGNRSIYASSAHLSDLLNSKALSLLISALEVGSELAQRYQASVKRIGNSSKHISAALLANHYNIDLDRVQQIAQAFSKATVVNLADPGPVTTPTPRSKDKTPVQTKGTTKSHATDLVALATSEDQRWSDWGDVRVRYYPKDARVSHDVLAEGGRSSQPSTPTPLRRSSTIAGTQHTPKPRNTHIEESSPSVSRMPGMVDEVDGSAQKTFDIPQSILISSSMSQLLDKLPNDMTEASKYEAFHRFRVAKALTGSQKSRQKILGARLLAITNLAYIHTESNFVEKVLRQDMDETRRYQLVYQLAELIHPSSDGNADSPLWLQTISLALMEAMSSFPCRAQDVLSALNANVNHGVLLYVIRKAVAGMEVPSAEDDGDQVTETDNWRNNLFSLTLNLSMATRIGSEMASAGLMEILVHILNIRSSVAERHHSMVLAFLDGLIWAFSPAFMAFFSADGLDAVSKLVVDTVAEAKNLVAASKGITPEHQSSAVDYEVPYYQQQTLKWLLKFIHRIMSNSYNYSGNTERLLRNLAEKSDLLASLRDIIRDKTSFGSVIWTNSVLILSDFINNDPTSYAAISESGMIKTYLEAITGRSITDMSPQDEIRDAEEGSNEASEASDVTAMIERDQRPHPPSEELLRTSKHGDVTAGGILASSEAINVVPQVLNSISLNNSGMKLVVSSRAFDSYLEIFESPEHVRCMELDIDLPNAIGGSFDELARHHPPLRTAISNAVIDMVAKVRYFGIRKAEEDNWGVRLLGTDETGKVVSIDQHGHVTRKSEDLTPAKPTRNSDVTMQDSATPQIVEDDTSEPVSSRKPDTITPYIYALATFLTSYLSSTFIKTNFVEKGGIELLLDICELPSLPANYSESPAARSMNLVVAQLVEHAPVRSLPSLLKRAQNSIDTLRPLAMKTEALPPYFGPFLSPNLELPGLNLPEPLLSGTKIVKALLNAQNFIKILSDCFNSSRSHSLQFYPVNAFDYYLQLIKSMGPLLRGVLAEEAGELATVPQHWSIKRGGSSPEGEPPVNNAVFGNDSTSLPDVLKSTGAWKQPEGAEIPKSPTEEEQKSTRFHNYEALKLLLHPMIPTSFPLFQNIGKALVPRRELSPSVSTPNPGSKEFHYWIIMMHTIHEMLIDNQPGRQPDRTHVHIIIPVLLAFKEQGGLDVLNTILRIFTNAVREGSNASRPDELSKAKVAAFGLKKILELYVLLVNGKYLVDTSNQFNLQRHTDRNQVVSNIYQQIVVEFRCAILPPMLEMWDSTLVEHVSDETAKRILDILKLVATAENEPASTPKDKAPFLLLNYTDVRFDWRPLRGIISDLSNVGFDADLVHEAVFRANGNPSNAREYCRAHKAGLAGPRNPIPAEDADVNTSKTPESSRSRQRAPSTGTSTSEPDRMSLDTFTEGLDDDGLVDTEAQAPEESDCAAGTAQAQVNEQSSRPVTKDGLAQAEFSGTKEELDALRLRLRSNLIDHSLDVIRTHPDCAIEVSELIQTMVLQHQDQETHEEVGSVLTSALSSLALDPEEKKKNGKCIAAYAHLLALLLQDQAFFENNVDGLRDKVGEYVDFLKVPNSSAIDELSPWIPYILLVLEPLLSHDERPVAAQWLAPRTVDDPVQPAVVQLGISLISDQQRSDILESLLDLLPRVGKQEILATSILRVLVIVTRRRSLAKQMGRKKNLQRLFLMAKQLAGHGSERMKQIRATSHIIAILRHIVEDEETLRQIIRAEIKAEFPNVQRNNRGHADVSTYLRTLAPIALRAPELFVEVSNEMLRFSRWSPAESETAGRLNSVALKDGIGASSDSGPLADAGSSKDQPSGTDASNTADEVKPSTELTDKEMADAPKITDSKRPVVENPDGVVHFLLCELVNYREVDDKEPAANALKDAQPELDVSDAGSEQFEKEPTTGEGGDKKQIKPQFKSEEHPIFVYRCFLLNCLSELLQSYTRTKVEFINFKRSAPPISTGTPIKPRTGILNYLIYDLLCQGNLAGTADNIAAKKKLATSAQTQRVLVALVSKTSEKPASQSQEKFAYDDEPDLLFVRKFVLDTILRAYERAPLSDEPFETRYSRMQSLAELMMHMIGDRDKDQHRPGARNAEKSQSRSQAQIRRLMYEKGYLDKLTTSIAELSLNYPGVKRAIKYILRVLRILTDTAKELSHSNLVPSDPGAEQSEDECDESSSSLSDLEDDREETPDLYRNSALGMLEPRDEDDESESEDEDEDADMYGDEYDEEMDYGDEEMSDGEDDISDDDEELGEMGDIEGLHGEPGVVEVIMDDDENDEDEDDDESDGEGDSADSADMEDMEDRVEIVDEDGNPIEDDSAWESDSDMDENDEQPTEDVDYEAEVQDEVEARIHGMGPRDLLDNMARAIMGDDEGYGQEIMDGLDDHYMDEDQDDVEDDEEDEEEIEDEEYFDEDDFYAPEDHLPHLPSGGWDGMNPEVDDRHRLLLLENNRRPVFTRMENRGGLPARFVGTHRDGGDFRSYFSRMHRPPGQQSHPEDGSNPLLRRNDTETENSSRAGNPNSFGLRLPETIFTGGGRHMIDGPMSFLGELMEFLPMMGRNNNGQAFHVQISRPGGPRGEFAPIRPGRHDARREVAQEPHQAVAFTTESTVSRYSEEARMIFGTNHVLEASKLSNAISAALTPAAVEHQKKVMAVDEENRKRAEEIRQKLEEEQKEKDAKEAEERAEKERQENEERERQAALDAAVAADADQAQDGEQSTAMEGVESANSGGPVNQPEASSAPRVTTTIRGEEVDITELGIDPDYLAALPEEFREEVIAQTVSERRSQALQTAPAGESTEVFQEFLDALPEELRLEIAQQERQEQRRREGNRRQAGNAGIARPADMDTASILQTFPPELRDEVLLQQGQSLMDQLTPEMAAQSRALNQHTTPAGLQRGLHSAAPSGGNNLNAEAGKDAESKPPRRTVVQMLDKAGVATLLRLMFITHQGSFRNYLFAVFADVCENRQSRLEVVSTLLQILQDGSTDVNAVERSFGQLSIKAKRLKDKEREIEPRTPQSLKRTLTSLSVSSTAQTSSETSPLLIVQQCLDLLVDLCARNPHIPWLFLTEHETVGASLRKAFGRKGKAKDSKASKYAINALLTLLDRELITESSLVMTHLADLLNRVTLPLQNLERRRRESLDAVTTKPEKSGDGEQDGEVQSGTAGGANEGPASDKSRKQNNVPQKRSRQLQPPVIPEENLTLVVRIFVARECSSKTFQNTIATIKNLCAIPGTKAIFGQELIRQARALSENIVTDLNELLPHILAASSGTEIQGVALAKFSPGASDQNKLLRVLTALDHLFEPKKKAGQNTSDEHDEGKQDLLTSLYHNQTFLSMWDKLSSCLSAIRQRENMLSVATILLPLIESLMVVCKNTTTKDDALPSQQPGEEPLASPVAESQTASLFFSFTEEHRRILNELVRHSPKLMSGTFALLVRNPKVLEFDNKRNYFNRTVHSRAAHGQSRPSYPPLQLSVRRESVYRDSFANLYYKSGDEIKYGKLNIRFGGEEGVDAGGVTREWFQVLARQMFDPNNALFIPVSSDRTTFHPNKLSKFHLNEDSNAGESTDSIHFKFIGRIIGKALYEGRLLDCFFSRAVYKRILGKSVSVKDMESFDPDYYKSLCWMLENDITDIITETFSEEEDEFGVTKIVDLVPNGREIPVTEENKQEYVRLVVEHRLLTSVKDQMESFLKGFHEIIPAELISIFNEQELELLISGLPDIDIDDWRSNTEYHNYTPSSQQVQWFWRAVRSFDKEELAKLLQFVTGTSKVPLNGFKELEGMNGISRFNIHRDYGDKDRLPTSHTCFNQLDIPEYDSYDTLRAQLYKAITAGNEYFGFA
ncbi:HECT (ubiquitin-transferase) domain-containing protein [Cordyceps javanica]|uniref:HECT-type E3 ubiquitin transferase n=1 Tax=Cordyceps javanica TaxID=43265 RepID=A0A545V8E6_9HYPO|nr:HECT (ubiquitin-transferase) domain-containing protein [Cordyceps javanica]TQW08817.1 HECT (ubiquitin-transferase) domain-containing protein [Cordyceps javanica]